MIAADKKALAADVQQQVLRIREREINLYSNNLNALGTQAALVAGFAFAGLVNVDVDDLVCPPDLYCCLQSKDAASCWDKAAP